MIEDNRVEGVAMPRVSIFGAGNAGLTAAYHFSKQGSEVFLYGSPGFDQQIDAIVQAGGIRSVAEYGATALEFSGFAPIHRVGKDIQQAVEFSDILILPVPSFAQVPLFEQMLPYLSNGQTLVLMPGNYGSLELSQVKNRLGYRTLELNFVDAISIPWATRIIGDAEIAILGLKSSLPMAALPASKTGEMIDKLQPIFPLPLTPLANVVAAGLENINFGGHPLMTTLNIGLLENYPNQFNYYRDCCSPATSRACELMDQERLALGQTLGLNLKSELEAMNQLYDMSASSIYELNRTSQTHGSVNSAPSSSRSRYITEDVPYLLVPCLQLGQLSALEMPIVSSVLNLASAFNDTDYVKSGRTLEKMGLANMSPAEIMTRVS